MDHDSININFNPHISNDEPYKRMIECIVKHSQGLELVNLIFALNKSENQAMTVLIIFRYAQMIESANSLSFLFQLGINMVTISFTGFQVSAIFLCRKSIYI